MVLELQRETLGNAHAGTLGSMVNLAVIRMNREEYDEAALLAGEAYEARVRTLGQHDPATLDALAWLGLMQVLAGRVDEAEALLSGGLPVMRRVLPDGARPTDNAIHSLALVYEHQGRFDEALALPSGPGSGAQTKRLGAHRRLHGDPPVELQDALASEHREEAKIIDPEGALSLALEAAAMTEYGDPVVLGTLMEAYQVNGNLSGAVETYRKAVSLMPLDSPSRPAMERALGQLEQMLAEQESNTGGGGG
jgi:tetratricopeptide (TPR) repeat protein